MKLNIKDLQSLLAMSKLNKDIMINVLDNGLEFNSMEETVRLLEDDNEPTEIKGYIGLEDLENIVNALNPKDVEPEFKIEDNTLVVYQGDSRLELKDSQYGTVEEEYNTFKKLDKDIALEFDTKEFKKDYNKLKEALCKDGARPTLNNIQFDFTEDDLRLVALDGYRMIVKYYDIQTNLGKNYVVNNFLFEALKKVKSNEEIFRLEINEEYSKIDIGNLEIYGKNISKHSSFDYESIIRDDDVRTIKIDDKTGQSMIKLLERMSKIDKQTNKGNLVKLTKENDVNLEAEGKTLKLEQKYSFEDDDITVEDGYLIGFNSKYMTDALAVFENEEITMGFNGELDPIMLRGTDWLSLVLPIRLP